MKVKFLIPLAARHVSNSGTNSVLMKWAKNEFAREFRAHPRAVTLRARSEIRYVCNVHGRAAPLLFYGAIVLPQTNKI